MMKNTSCCNPGEKELTHIEQLVEQTLRLEQMEADCGVDVDDVFLKSCANCA